MATNISIPTYGFVNHILALNEGNWRRFFKPFITDSVQSGLATIEGANMTVYVSAGECRCGAVMGILDEMIVLDVADGDSTYDRIDSVVVQYTYGEPSTLAVAIVQGTPSANPVPPTLTKVYDTLWQMEIAQILVPSGATSASEFTITDKRVIYESIESIIDDNTESEERVWSSQKTHEEIVSLSTEIYDSLNTKADAIERTTSGDIVTITDGGDNIPVKELVVGIEPVQDLHGQANPYPAGGGSNLIPEFYPVTPTSSGWYRNDESGTHYGYAGTDMKVSEGDTIYCGIFNAPSGTSKNILLAFYDSSNQYISGITISSSYATVPANTAYMMFRSSGSISQLGENVQFMLSKSAVTTYSPYSNVCPISGRSSAKVTRTGKNLFDVTNYPFTSGYLIRGDNGNKPTATGYMAVLDMIPFEAYVGQTITLNKCPGGQNGGIAFYDANRNYIGGVTNNNATANTPMTVTVPSGTKYMRFCTVDGNTDIQIELGSTATAYEPYHEMQQITVQFPVTLQNPEGVYYGGNVNLSTGILTIDRIKKKVGDYAWSKNTGTHIFYSNIDRTIKPQTSIICSEYKSVSWEVEEDDMPDLSIKLGTAESNQQQICIRDDRYSNASTFKSDMSDVEFVYYLNEPAVMHLHPQQISTLLGFNNIFADSGDILSLTYRADMKTYVDEQVAEANLKTRQMMTTVTTEMVAPSNLVVGDIVIVNDDLYKVINHHIASGEEMTVGTNVIKITLTEYIQSLI